MANTEVKPADPMADRMEQQYDRAREEWLSAVESNRPHAVVNAHWEVMRSAARQLGLIPGVRRG